MQHARIIITAVALLMIFALSGVLVAMGQSTAAVTTLIPSLALGAQQIVRAGVSEMNHTSQDSASASIHRAFGDRARGEERQG
ncbi:hypothetical protein ACWGNF_09675 [Streptomyces sp. NPDC055808]